MLVTSLCRVVTLLVSEPILDCSEVMLFCRPVTAVLALWAAVAAACALLPMVESIEEIELTLVVSELTLVLIVPIDVERPVIVVPHALMFLSMPVIPVSPDVDTTWLFTVRLVSVYAVVFPAFALTTIP